ncbi:hypothetical protein OTSANNIE_0609 [Anaplasma phagocytophilum str. Annie]|nr:hypothetical protein APHHGE2_0633 [Anaplasma phagocytophilum str. HGE2]KJV87588.1 hypothetical protein APHNYW_0442 [Anaplasma phagocytophilum str. ApNYW]KJV99122.1 hypothetical protein OTSANNIE_0688 [Anaplasma phagocytophilum str. Annie]KJV83457.1 hypothetical protein APHHGE2_0710 [Anaplasma phagocytophilum str. HGE2]KJV87977.1 hypothetical protein APHNYW_0364 [Anaplasma phagocytophilum str. ApNYW]
MQLNIIDFLINSNAHRMRRFVLMHYTTNNSGMPILQT